MEPTTPSLKSTIFLQMKFYILVHWWSELWTWKYCLPVNLPASLLIKFVISPTVDSFLVAFDTTNALRYIALINAVRIRNPIVYIRWKKWLKTTVCTLGTRNSKIAYIIPFQNSGRFSSLLESTKSIVKPSNFGIMNDKMSTPSFRSQPNKNAPPNVFHNVGTIDTLLRPLLEDFLWGKYEYRSHTTMTMMSSLTCFSSLNHSPLCPNVVWMLEWFLSFDLLVSGPINRSVSVELCTLSMPFYRTIRIATWIRNWNLFRDKDSVNVLECDGNRLK